ncbi:hybrid sensor histidine kinase/response regulator [Moraxella caviae]|uniref:histidine kinase n=1 Tax=Moraxella caviae TaxID=34060 RepID=A0A1S9ZVE8_9GAMM|nr:hybrid sensor histidine kinase/response regulator [Moraxella caviae]
MRSAYGQLILLVFLPIVVLAMVGGLLVFFEVRRAIISEQDVQAQAALVRYETLLQPLLQGDLSQNLTQNLPQNASPDLSQNSSQNLPKNASDAAHAIDVPALIDKLNQLRLPQVQRVALADAVGAPILAAGVNAQADWGEFDTTANRVARLPVAHGTAYGKAISVGDERFWLLIEMDNEPLTITYYRVLLALSITGLITILLLLLILNSYAKRWIEPVYEMRLYLQRLTAENLSKPAVVRADGEFALLQKDFMRALSRLDASFTELKNHAEETERDLQQAFDEMEMQNISIRNARDAAISASQAKSAFLANISHELRTPLNSIDGFINLLARKQGLSSEQNLYVQTIKKSSAHLLALVNDVLDFSKIEAGKLVLDHHEFDLYAAIYDVVDMLSPAALEKHLRLAVLFYHDVPTHVVGDSLRVKQILTNLVGNAIKFTDSGGVVVRVSLSSDTPDFLNIAVEDTGKGVSEADKAQLFKSFSQGDLSVTRRYGGTGLGLVISKQLTALMGGSIGFYDNNSENVAKTGTTFWFEMPTGVAHDDEALDDKSAAIKLPALGDGKPLSLLVWINHLPAVQVLKASLAMSNVQITLAIGLADLLEQLDNPQHGFDWVIVDNFGQDAAQDDVGAILRQIRLRYQGRLATYGYQVGIDNALLEKYHTHALHEPLDKRQLYAMLSNRKDASTQAAANPHRFAGVRVLAVDDHLPNLLVLDALLGELGVEVVTAGSGFDAIEIMSKTVAGSAPPIDLIFMDIQMPRMSGREASIQIRKIEQAHLAKPVPIIALTAHGLSDEKDRLVAAGLDDYVGKPIGHVQLVQTLEKWLHRGDEPSEPLSAYELAAKDGFGLPSEPSAQAAPSVAGATLADIDWADALERSANKADLAQKLLQMMIDDAENEKRLLERAWADRDRAALAELSHRTVGASRYAGVPRLRKVSADFEAMCRADITQTSASHFIAMRPSYRALIDALDSLQAIDLKEFLQNPHTKATAHTPDDVDEARMAWKMV